MMKLILLIILMLTSVHSYGLTIQERERWRADINFYSNELAKNHINLFHAISSEFFYSEIERIKRSLPHITKNELLVELMKLTRRVDDGHTSFPLWGGKLKTFPFELKIFNGEAYVIKTTNAYKNLVGGKLVAINRTPTTQVIKLFSKISPFTENEFSTAVRVAEYMTKAALLEGLGLISNGQTVSFVFEVNNKKEEYQLDASYSYSLDFDVYLSDSVDSRFLLEEKVNDDLWFGATQKKKTIYFKFRRYASMSKMDSLAKKLHGFIKRHKSKNLIIDLRGNYGGDFFVGLKLAQFLVLADSIDWGSGVYVLIDDVTFSAAMSNAAQFSQLLNAQLVGTPTGAKPLGYQDMGQFTLPNSKLEVTYSKRFYRFSDSPKNALYPDVRVESTITDYLNKNDRPLNWVMSNIQRKESSL